MPITSDCDSQVIVAHLGERSTISVITKLLDHEGKAAMAVLSAIESQMYVLCNERDGSNRQLVLILVGKRPRHLSEGNKKILTDRNEKKFCVRSTF